MSIINQMIDAVVRCPVCGALMGKCDCYNRKTQHFRCKICRKDADYVKFPEICHCEQHYAEYQVEQLKPNSAEQKELWLQQILEILRSLE